MREIIFRGKRKDNGEWVEGSLILTTSTMEKPFIVDSCWCYSGSVDDEGYAKFEYLNAYEVIPETVGQYTGLTDKNGKRIFEGDIVAWNNEELDDIDGLPFEDELSVVQFCEERKGYINRGIDIEFVDDFVGFDKNCYRVIGNIHDNPELLKGDG